MKIVTILIFFVHTTKFTSDAIKLIFLTLAYLFKLYMLDKHEAKEDGKGSEKYIIFKRFFC